MILTTGFVHILSDGYNDLSERSSFPFATFICLGSIIFMFFLEQASVTFLRSRHQKPTKADHAHRKVHFHDGHERHHENQHHGDDSEQDNPGEQSLLLSSNQDTILPKDSLISTNRSVSTAVLNRRPSSPGTIQVSSQEADHVSIDIHGEGDHKDHVHLPLDIDYTEGVKAVVIAHVLELGILIHSVLIGIDLGITTDAQSLHSLLIALCFHQFFEGIGLGSALAVAQVSRARGIIFSLMFAATTPIGVGVGIAIASTYDPESSLATWLQGSLDSAASGILIYAGLVEMVVEDFVRCEEDRPVKKVAMAGAVLLGYGLMSMLAIWA